MEPGLESITSRAPPSPRSLRPRAVTGSGGTWDQVHRPEAGAAAVGEGPSPGGPDLASPRPCAGPGTLARGALAGPPPAAVAEQTSATPRPGRSPSLSRCASPGPPPHTQSRVCLARERCPWLHNSPDGIRPGVFLNRAAKKCEFSVGSGSWPPPSCESGGDTRGVSGPLWGGLGGGSGRRRRPLLGTGGRLGLRVGSLSLVRVKAPKLCPPPLCSS